MKLLFPTLAVGGLLLGLGIMVGPARLPEAPSPFLEPPRAESGDDSPAEIREYKAPEESVVINEVQYHPESEDRRDEWIELFNRGTAPVDLGGWKLGDAVKFTFPSPTLLGPGAHLVVCADPQKVSAGHGVERVLGPWNGELPDGKGTVRLLAGEREVDRLDYDDGGEFPAVADGGGRSLERRNPHSPGNFAGNWGASSSRGWLRVQAQGSISSQKLYVYLLGPGTAYLDDLIIRPADKQGDGAGESVRIDFERETGEWEAQGNHSGSEVSTEAARSGRRSLKVVASGPGKTLRTSVSADFPELEIGRDHVLECWVLMRDPRNALEVRFSGSSRSRAVVQEGALLPAPGGPPAARELAVRVVPGVTGSSPGTPGRKNSLYTTVLPPYLRPVTHSPERPKAGEPVVVTARLAPPTEASEVLLHYDEGSGVRTVRLEDSGVASAGDASRGDRLYSARIGPFSRETLLRYRVSARGQGGEGRYPFEGSATSSLGFYVEDPEARSRLPIYMLFLSPEVLAELQSNPFSDLYRPGTFVHDGRVYFDVGVRFRGQTSRHLEKHHWKVRFNKDNRFLTPGGHKVRSININSSYADKTYLREVLGYTLWRDMGEAYHETFHVRLYLNGTYHGLYVHLEVPNEDFMERNGLAPGFLWKAYGQSRQGNEAYELEVGDPQAAPEILSGFLPSIGRLSGRGETEKFIRDRMLLDSFVNFLVGCQLIHSADHVEKNYLIHADQDLKFTFLPWDLDLTHGRNYECNAGGIWNDVSRHDLWDPETGDERLLFGTQAHRKCDGFWNPAIDAFLNRTRAFLPLYYRRLAEHLAHHYHPDILIPKMDRLRDLISEEVKLDRRRWRPYGRRADFDSDYQELREWVGKRYRHLKGKLEALKIEVPEPINACFESAGKTWGPGPLTVKFRSLSEPRGQIQSHAWDFGDGQTSSEKDPAHVYTKPGTYAVSLKVTGPKGSHTAVRRAFVRVSGTPAVAASEAPSRPAAAAPGSK